ncbi:MAG: antitoxin component YwqK of YwqJK toxin-antitoxin module [Flavobacteriales bacterium]|jgi:antitoxin component YwqK of YwqJK toxin-antitoxin module
MKTWKIYLLLSALFISASVYAQPGKAMPDGQAGVDYNRVDTQGLKQGNWVRVYENGKLYYKGLFENDVPLGEFWFWYDTGEAMSKVIHLEGSRHMEVINYHKNGHLMSKGEYREGVSIVDGIIEKLKSGEWTFYNDEGLLKTEENYSNGLRNGKSITYFTSGKVLLEYNFVNDLREGPWIEYFENGRTKSEGSSLAGDFDGPFSLFLPSGSPKITGSYVKGTKDGIWIHFNSSGTIQLTTKYSKGAEIASRRENGEFTDYFESGIPEAYYEIEHGLKEGPFKEFYDQGEWIQEAMDEPQPGGGIQFKEKLLNTQVLREGDYLEGKLEGPVTYYDERGRIIRIENYVDGVLESTEEK